MKRIAAIAALLVLVPAMRAFAGKKKPEQPPIVPVAEEEKKQLLEKETPEQKKLRAEMAELAGKGHRIYFQSNIHGHNDIFTINPDGTGLERLTDDPRDETYPHVCNTEVTADGKHLTYVIDTFRDQGSWLCYQTIDGAKGGRRIKMDLGWNAKSVNYYQDTSPDVKYMVYSHGDFRPGIKPYHFKSGLELYVSRFPPDKTNIRITWNGAANYHPQWVGPKGE
jgi:hypothetical protein